MRNLALTVLVLVLAATSAVAQDAERSRAFAADGNRYLQQGEIVQAIEMFTASVNAHSGNLSSYTQRATCYLRLGHYYQAHEDMGTVLKIFGGSTRVGGGERAQAESIIYGMRASVAIAIGDYKSVEADAQAAIQRWSVNPQPNIALGQAMILFGRAKDAEAYFQTAKPGVGPKTFTDPLDVHAGIVLARLATGDKAGALAAAAVVATEQPDQAAAGLALEILVLAETAKESSELDKALARLKKPELASTSWRLLAQGILYKKLGRREEALAALREFTAAPFHLIAREALGELLALAGDVEGAARELAPLAAMNAELKARVGAKPWGARVLARATGVEEETSGRSTAERGALEREREVWGQIAAELRTALRRQRHAEARAELERTKGQVSGSSVVASVERATKVVATSEALFAKVVAALAGGKLKDAPFALTSEISAKITSATTDELTIDVAGTSTKMAWWAVSFDRYVELAAAALDLSAEQWLDVAELACELDERSHAERAFAKAIASDAIKDQVAKRYAEWQGEELPAGGYAVHDGKLVAAADKDKLAKGMVRYQGGWVTKEDLAHLRKGHQKIKDKWVPLTAEQLKARGYTQDGGEWLSPEEAQRKRGEWAAAWRQETAHFVIRTNKSEAFAAKLAEVAEAAHERLVQFFGERSKGAPKLTLYAYAKYDDYQAYCTKLGNTSVLAAAGFAPSEPHTACGWDKASNDISFLQTMIHESAHLYFWEKYSAPVPSWLAEGMATYFEGFRRKKGAWHFDHKADSRLTLIKDAVQSGQFIPLKDLFGSDAGTLINTNSSRALVFYAECWAVFYFFNQTTNTAYKDAFTKVFEKLRRRANVDLETELGAPLQQLEKEIQAYVKSL